MGRLTEQQIHLDGQIRFWEDKQRKSRTIGKQLQCAAVLKQLRAERWPSPIAAAQAAKIQMKADRLKAQVAAKEAKEAEEAEQARLEAQERRKLWEESNPVIDQVRRGAIQREIRERDAAQAAAVVPVMEVDSPSAVEPQDAAQVPDGGQVSPEIQRITLEAEAAAKKHSTGAGAEIASSAASHSITAAWSQPLPHVDPFTEYQDKVAQGEELRRRHREQHPVWGDVREEGRLIDSYTGRSVKREE